MIQQTRIQPLNRCAPRKDGKYVLYWMQAAQRAGFNPALEFALERANDAGLPLQVVFGVTGFPEANARHYAFMLQGLKDISARLERRGVGFCVRYGAVDPVVTGLAKDAALVVCDRGYLRVQRDWRRTLAANIDCELVQIEGEVVVPVKVASDKHEYAARTIRPKLHRVWEDYIVGLTEQPVQVKADSLKGDVPLDDLEAVARKLDLDTDVRPVKRFRGGETAAREVLEDFLDDGLSRYADQRQKPEAGAASFMSPYLHFGQISPVEIALAVRGAKTSGASENKAKYLEELIVRRELAINHVLHEPDYDKYACLPDWAHKALDKASDDERPHHYTRSDFEAAETHDRYWNAAMIEMKATGYMHNQMRMYWGKKVLEWSVSPKAAFDTLLYLNNKYFLDGRDPNSFTNVGWIFGLHDRPWGPQPVFGTVRSMGANTFKKFDAEAYVADVDEMAKAEGWDVELGGEGRLL